MAKMLCVFSKNILTKIEIVVPLVVRSALQLSQVVFATYRFGWCEREVQENSADRERMVSKFSKCTPFSTKLRSLYVLLAF